MKATTVKKLPILLGFVFASVVLYTVAIAYAPDNAYNGITSPSQVVSVGYTGNVCVTTTGDFEGRLTPASVGINELVQCDHNLVMDVGLNATINALIVGGNVQGFDFIGICNATVGAGCSVPAAGDTTLANEYDSSGLHRQQGTAASLGNGNYTIFQTFTANSTGGTGGAGHITNSTGIFNATKAGPGTLLAANTFTLVTLQNNDQLTVNWTIFVENG